MGNKQSTPPEAMALHDCSPLVCSVATKVRVEHLHDTAFRVYDQVSGELLFHVKGDEWDEPDEKVLVNAKNTPVVKIEEYVARRSYNLLFRIKSPGTPHREL